MPSFHWPSHGGSVVGVNDQRARSYTVLVEGLVQKRPGVFSVVRVVDLGVHGKAAEDVHDGIGVEELPFVTCVPEIGDIPRPHLIGPLLRSWSACDALRPGVCRRVAH